MSKTNDELERLLETAALQIMDMRQAVLEQGMAIIQLQGEVAKLQQANEARGLENDVQKALGGEPSPPLGLRDMSAKAVENELRMLIERERAHGDEMRKALEEKKQQKKRRELMEQLARVGHAAPSSSDPREIGTARDWGDAGTVAEIKRRLGNGEF